MTESENDDDLKQRLNRLIGRLGALNECVDIVNQALEDETGLEDVRAWLSQALDELKVEEELIKAETGF